MFALLSPLALVCLQPAAAEPAAAEPVAPVQAAEAPGPRRPLDSERPSPTPPRQRESEAALEEWEREHRRLKLHAGLSGGFAGAMVLTGVLLFVLPGRCSNPDPDFGCGEIFAPYFIGAALFPLALIPTGTGIYWGVRLHRHKQSQPTAVLRPSAGGFALHF